MAPFFCSFFPIFSLDYFTGSILLYTLYCCNYYEMQLEYCCSRRHNTFWVCGEIKCWKMCLNSLLFLKKFFFVLTGFIKQNIMRRTWERAKWELPPAPHLASPCLLLPLSSGNGEKLKQTLVHLLIPPAGKRAHKLSSYFLWPWGGCGMGKQNQMMGCLEVVEVTAQCVVAIGEGESGGKGQGGGQGHTQ